MIMTTGPPQKQVPKNRRVQESKLLADWDAAGGFSSVLFGNVCSHTVYHKATKQTRSIP